MTLGTTYRTLLALGLLASQTVALPSPAAGASQMGPPLPGSPCPTSSFGSRRATHIHAGVDFSTGGRTGVPVLAVDTCRVWRISVKNAGYGRALYVELADGRIVVYGHLSRFAAGVEAAVEAEQERLGRYEVELYPEGGAFQFALGETLALSGETGAGPPHLHFELRSGKADFDNISPVPDLTALRDTAPPKIANIRIEPVGPDCTLDGGYESVTLTPTGAAHALAITGPFAVSVKATDVALCERVISPTLYEAYVDGEPVWRLNLVEFPFAKTHFVKAIYDLVDGAVYARVSDQYHLDFEGFDYYGPRGGRFFEELAPGAHVLRVVAGDPWGNYDDLTVPFTYGNLPCFRACRLDDGPAGIRFEAASDGESRLEVSWRAAGGAWRVVECRREGDGWVGEAGARPTCAEVKFSLVDPSGLGRDCILAPGGAGGDSRIEAVVHTGFVEIYARTPSPPRAIPLAQVRQGGRTSLVVLQPAARNIFRGAYLPGEARGAIEVRAMLEFDAAGTERFVTLPVEHLIPGEEVAFEGKRFAALLKTDRREGAGTLVELSERADAGYEGFDSCFARLDFVPGDTFFGRGLEVRVASRGEAPGPKVGLFSLAAGAPGLLAAFDATGTCSARVYDLSSLAILKDTQPPTIRFTGRLARTRGGLGTFTGSASDGGSGVDSRSVRASVDGEAAIASYDPDNGGITVRTTKPLPYGTHRLRLEADDRLGNSARSEIQRELVR
jgi:murein DD-endopeptidase MepM/ murein hydrolase activator NlpD